MKKITNTNRKGHNNDVKIYIIKRKCGTADGRHPPIQQK